MPDSPPCPKNCNLTATKTNVFVWYTNRYPRVYPWNTYPFVQSIHVIQQSLKGECSASRDILTLKQHVSFSLFRPCQRVSPWWPTVPRRTVDYQHSRGWQRSRSDLPHGVPLEPPHNPQR
ncbi:hypothetical protein TNCV_1535941 [Trichonephila clavipes]|nr:hypothetical protein TNCV_1535941 [Trichonephila clavipes]